MKPYTFSTAILMIGFLAVAHAIAQSLPCDTQYPIYSDKEGKPIWLNSMQLKRRATHCEVPKPPALAQRVRMNGKAKLAILVNPRGTVECIKVISGHPLIADLAVEAPKAWKFKPLRIQGKALAFCGFLEFHLTTDKSDHSPDPCLCAHW